ncbi:MAG: hypothetical protein AB7F89_12050 [Pirellulaceae bacterium]
MPAPEDLQGPQDLLGEVREFCNPTTGEVLQRIPDDTMQRLRAAKLARGVPRCKSDNTHTNATWYVFLTDDIRQRVLAEIRAANHKRARHKKARAAESRSAPAAPAPAPPPPKRGLAKFRSAKRQPPK